MKKVKFNLTERVHFLNNTPKMGSVNDLLVIKKLISKIQITDKEKEEFEFTDSGTGLITWNAKGKESVIEIELDELQERFFKKILSDMDTQKIIPIEMLDFFTKYSI